MIRKVGVKIGPGQCAGRFGAFAGGSPLNIATGLTRLGMKAALLTGMGEDKEQRALDDREIVVGNQRQQDRAVGSAMHAQAFHIVDLVGHARLQQHRTVDHRVPRSRGGSNALGNLVFRSTARTSTASEASSSFSACFFCSSFLASDSCFSASLTDFCALSSWLLASFSR